MEEKQCIRCLKVKPIDAFKARTTDAASNAKRNTCRECSVLQFNKKTQTSLRSYLSLSLSTARSRIKQKHHKKQITIDENVNTDYLMSLWELQGGKCAISGVYMTHHRTGGSVEARQINDFNVSMDRIINEKPYEPGNIQLVAYRANIMKSSLPSDMFYFWIKTICKHSCD